MTTFHHADEAVEWALKQSPGQRVLVCGSRDASPRGRASRVLRAVLTSLRPSAIVHGAAPGVDIMADEWAWWHGVESVPFAADWKAGPRAGPVRNERMARESGATLCVAIHHGTRGTQDMVRRAHTAGMTVCEVILGTSPLHEGS